MPVTPAVPRSRATAASVTGLAIAWGGTLALLSPAAARLLGDPYSVGGALRGQAAFWLLCTIVLAIVWWWERDSLASLWLRPWSWRSIGWGLILAAAIIVLVMPAREWVRRTLALGGYATGMEQVLAWPVWVRAFAVVTAGVIEETLFTGYAVTRLARLTGHLSMAAALALFVFCALHVPVWGVGPSVAFFVGGIPGMAFFLVRRDLLAMIVAHIAVDGWGLVIAPWFSAWWTDPTFS